nr:hypothetical protein [Tanacetum cinerariifolium]
KNNSSNGVNAASSSVSTDGYNFINNTNNFSAVGPSNAVMPNVEDLAHSNDTDDVGAEADINNLESIISISLIPTTKIHKDHLTSQIIGDLSLTTQTRSMARAVRDQGGILQMFNEYLHVCLFSFTRGAQMSPSSSQGSKNKKDERGIVIKNKSRLVAQGHTQEEGIDYEEVFAPLARIEAIRMFLAYASFMGFPVYQMYVKSAFLYGTIKEEVYVCQPPGFEDPKNPDKVYKAVTALYGLHQAPRAWSSGKAKEDEIFISQDKYVAEILKKFRLSEGKSASTLIDAEKPLVKDSDGKEVDVHTYRSMIGSLMYLTSSRPDIMFAVCACERFQMTPKVSHLNAVKRIFRYLKEKPYLGLWYPKDSSFDLVAYLDSDYAVVATSSTKAEYVATASGCAQVLWIQNQFLDYGVFNSPMLHVLRVEMLINSPWMLSKNWLVQKQMDFGKDISNPFMADNLPKIVWFLTHHVTFMKSWLVQKQMALGKDTSNPLIVNSLLKTICFSIHHHLTIEVLAIPRQMTTGLNTPRSDKDRLKLMELLDFLLQKDKSDAAREFEQIIDFLSGRYINHALTVNPHVYISCIKQFWNTAVVKRSGDVTRVGKGFSGVETPLFQTMLAVRDIVEEAKAQVPAQDDDVHEHVAEEVATDVVPPTPTSPSPSSPIIPSTPPHQSPCPPQPQDTEGLENANAAQQLEIVKLKARVKKLEKLNKVKSSKLRWFKKDEGIELVVDHGKDAEVLSMQEDDTEVQEAVEVVNTAKLITEVVTAAATQVVAASTPIPAAKPKILKIDAPPAVSTKRRKGVVIRDPEEELHTDTPAETPTVKDKGKGILIEDPKPMKKKDQVEMDAEYAKTLQEELDKEHEEAYKQIDWNAALDHVQSKEPQYIKRYHGIKKKPQSESKARKNMISYLKNTKGYKMEFFRGKTYDQILPIFQARFDANMKFLFKTREEMKKEDEEIIKSINKTPAQKATKRRRLSEEAQEADDLKKRLEIVQDEDDDMFVEATPLAQKVPVVDYQIVVIDNKPKYTIIRADDTHQFYISFTTLLKTFDREDLETL